MGGRWGWEGQEQDPELSWEIHSAVHKTDSFRIFPKNKKRKKQNTFCRMPRPRGGTWYWVCRHRRVGVWGSIQMPACLLPRGHEKKKKKRGNHRTGGRERFLRILGPPYLSGVCPPRQEFRHKTQHTVGNVKQCPRLNSG